jgi:hypothetical protein
MAKCAIKNQFSSKDLQAKFEFKNLVFPFTKDRESLAQVTFTTITQEFQEIVQNYTKKPHIKFSHQV